MENLKINMKKNYKKNDYGFQTRVRVRIFFFTIDELIKER